jgi:hypothetical protein
LADPARPSGNSDTSIIGFSYSDLTSPAKSTFFSNWYSVSKSDPDPCYSLPTFFATFQNHLSSPSETSLLVWQENRTMKMVVDC